MLALARAARRKLRRDALRSPAQHWEQLRWASSMNPTSDSRKQRLPQSLSSRHETRSLATAADIQSAPSDMAFNGLLQNWGSRVPPPSLSRLDSWDPSNPLIVNTTLASAAPMTLRRNGIGGDPVELHQNLYACLRIGRIDRATAIIQRLRVMYNPSAPEMVDAHNTFLHTLFELAQENPSVDSMAEIEEWYDTHLVRQAIEPNFQTFVTMIRAAMNLLEEPAREASIRKYLAIAEEYGPKMLDDINESPDFSDDEWDALIRLQPDQFVEPPPAEQAPDYHISTPEGRATLIENGIIPDPSLHIKPVLQKGAGLETLKKALTMFDNPAAAPFPHDMEGTQEDRELAYSHVRQRLVEKNATEASIERWKEEDAKLQDMGIHGVMKTKPIQALMYNWHQALTPLFKEELRQVKELLALPIGTNGRDERIDYAPYLAQLSAEKLSALTIQRVLNGAVQSSRDHTTFLKISNLAENIGRDIEVEVNSDEKRRFQAHLKKARSKARKEMLQKLSKTTPDSHPAPRVKPAAIGVDSLTQTEFPGHIRMKIGGLALELLLQSAFITVTAKDPQTGQELTSTQAAFSHNTGFINGKKLGWITSHQEILEKLMTQSLAHVSTVRLPMVAEPKPWTAPDVGGYFSTRQYVVREKSKNLNQRAYTHAAIANGDMDKVLAGLDVLGKVPWQINKDVLRVMVEAWNAGDGIGRLVAENHDMERPAELSPDASWADRMQWQKQFKAYENFKGGLHSQRCFINFQLEMARAYADEKKIYFPHNVDFRGRAYPIPPILNHMGADVSRGLLRFANGKELGTIGLQWLKVHLANLYGFDKASLKSREQFAMDNMSEIFDSATDPLHGRRWWTKAEDPWQCLACCIELRNALDSPDPTRYVSSLPVHQDGTCNGLQHYAALGGDEAGAAQVNLEPSDTPQDIYTGVADLVRAMVQRDAGKGKAIALFMEHNITRKVVKRTVMTNVYGVTYIGAKLQVLEELKKMFPTFEPLPGVANLGLVAMYVAKMIFDALGQIFNGAQEIQYWLGECGDRITTSVSPDQVRRIQGRLLGKPSAYDEKYQAPAKKYAASIYKKLAENLETFRTGIIWTTPLKMPVVQPYHKETKANVKTSLQTISVTRRSTADKVDKRKQLQAFPPNFIHSLDATHMMLSALKCSEIGLDFAAVHDSFWTHAADIPTLNVVLRDAFVRMHSDDIMGRLAAEFEARYAGHMYRAQIYMNSLVAKKIMNWRLHNKKNLETSTGSQRRYHHNAHVYEVALETQRQELLKSEDAEERKRGEEMVTPTSIWFEESDPKALYSARQSLLGESNSKKGAETFNEIKNRVLGIDKNAATAASTSESDLDDTAIETEEADDLEDFDVDAEEESDPNSRWDADLAAESAPSQLEPGLRAKAAQTKLVQVWLPLTFPPVPKKGSWDVTRLLESKYFFS